MSRFGRVPPSAGRDVIDRKACFLSLLAQAAVWLRELRVSQHFSTFYGSSVQSMDTQLDARHRRRTPTIHRGTAQRTISADATNPVGKKIRVNNFAACQCVARPGRTARMMRYSRSRPVLTLSPGLSQLACKQMRFVAGMNRERLGAPFGSSGLPHIADDWCQRGLRLRPNEGAT